MAVIEIREARAKNLARYFTGSPCKNGHISERMVSNRSCCVCLSLKTNRRHSRPLNVRRRNDARNKRRSENLEQVRKKHKAWRDKNREKLASDMREYRRNNPDKVRSSRKKTYKNTYHLILERNRKRRAIERCADGTFTHEDLIRIRRAQRDRCAACRKPLNGLGHADHIKALAKGGNNWPSNIQLLCASCNTRKHTKDPIDFMQELGYLL